MGTNSYYYEMRPATIPSYKTKEWNDGIVYYEDEYPCLLFAKDGEIYSLNGKRQSSLVVHIP